jgi:hypothetical protein
MRLTNLLKNMTGKIPVLISGFFFLASCVSVSTVYIQVLEPASDPVTPGISSAALLNRAVADEADGAFLPEERELYNRATTETLFSLAGVLNESPALNYLDEGVMLEMTRPEEKPGVFPGLLENEFVMFVCDSLQVDALISLEGYMIEPRDTIVVRRGVRETGWVNYLRGGVNVPFSALWRIYEGNRGNPVDEHIVEDTLNFEYAAFTLREIRENLPSLDEAVMESSYLAALNYARRIAPYWIEEERWYFSRGNTRMRRAAGHIENDRLDEAGMLLEGLLASRNKNIVAAAYHNLAFIHEMQGEYMEALKYARNSFRKRRHPVTEAYVEVLEGRLEKARTLDRQLGGER